MHLGSQKQDWDDLGSLDPLWAVLSDPKARFGRWNLEDFFARGTTEINEALAIAQTLGLPAGRGRALDFGCGVGRLTRALGRHFKESQGVDISESMILKARELNAGVPNVAFTTNENDDLRLFPDAHFDLVYTNLVLQHMSSRKVILSYLREFVRVLKQDGILVFQLPSKIPFAHRLQLRRRLYALLRLLGCSRDFLYSRLDLTPMRMSFIPKEVVAESLRNIGANPLRMRTTTSGYESTMYFVSKNQAVP